LKIKKNVSLNSMGFKPQAIEMFKSAPSPLHA